jgi:hypothetical protein
MLIVKGIEQNLSVISDKEEFAAEANSSLISLTDDVHKKYFDSVMIAETKNLLNLTTM